MSVEEKSGKEIKKKKSEEKEQPTQQETKSEKSSKSAQIKNKSKVKTAEKVQSLKRNVESDKKKGSKGTKEKGTKEGSKEVEEMPPTANSEKSSAQNQKKKKPKGGIASKTNPTAASSTPNISGNSKEPSDNGRGPTLTPTPDVGPNRNSKAMGVIETDQEMKKMMDIPNQEPRERKKRELKRETNHIYHVRPGVKRDVEKMRRSDFDQELIKYETGQFTYLTDPTRYHFRLPPPMDIVTQFVLPSLLILAIMLATVSCYIFLTKEYEIEMEFNELTEITMVKYESYHVVRNITEYLRNETILRVNNCPGLIQGPWQVLDKYEMTPFISIHPNVTRVIRALTYRWMSLAETIMKMNFDCPPSVIIEVSSDINSHRGATSPSRDSFGSSTKYLFIFFIMIRSLQ